MAWNIHGGHYVNPLFRIGTYGGLQRIRKVRAGRLQLPHASRNNPDECSDLLYPLTLAKNFAVEFKHPPGTRVESLCVGGSIIKLA